MPHDAGPVQARTAHARSNPPRCELRQLEPDIARQSLDQVVLGARQGIEVGVLEPLQVTGRLAFARGSLTQEGKTIALWSGVCRHVARAKAMARKDENAPRHLAATDQTVPAGFELFATASAYSRHIGPIYLKPESEGTAVVQPTLPRMCNSGGALHGGYLMSFADSAITRAAALATGMAPSTVSFAAEFLSAGDATAPLTTQVEIPRRGKSIAFLRGLVEQNGRGLLSYSATMMLRPRG